MLITEDFIRGILGEATTERVAGMSELEVSEDTRFAQLLLYWPRTPTRSRHTLLIDANLAHGELLALPAFKSPQLDYLDITEDAGAPLVAAE